MLIAAAWESAATDWPSGLSSSELESDMGGGNQGAREEEKLLGPYT